MTFKKQSTPKVLYWLQQCIIHGIRSILKTSRERSQLSFSPLWESLSQELLQASQSKGKVVAKRYKVNKLAISNKRKVHFAIHR